MFHTYLLSHKSHYFPSIILHCIIFHLERPNGFTDIILGILCSLKDITYTVYMSFLELVLSPSCHTTNMSLLMFCLKGFGQDRGRNRSYLGITSGCDLSLVLIASNIKSIKIIQIWHTNDK
jgi:hypothetical protein